MRIRLCFGFFLLSLGSNAAEAPVPTFQQVEVDGKIEIGYGLAIADVDGDKKTDILLCDKSAIVWYKNPSWEKHVIAEKLTQRDHVCIAAADIDGDGKAEIAVGAEWNPGDTLNSGSVHYLIAPADRTQKWEAVKLPHEPTVHRMRWLKNAEGKFDLVVVPLHGRGNKGGQGDGVKILAYQKPSDPKGKWTTELLNSSLHMTHNFDPVQWDSDPALEMLVGGKEGAFLLDRADNRGKLTQLAGNEGGGVGEIRVGRLSNRKRFFVTVEPMHGSSLVVYTAPGSGDTAGLWTRHTLDETLVDGHALGCGDMAGTGGDQIVVGWRAMMRPGAKVGLKLFTPLDADGKQWKQTLIDDNTMACEDLALADLNNDGKLDIVAAGRATKNLKVYWNQGVK
jgi:hypothetical protein